MNKLLSQLKNRGLFYVFIILVISSFFACNTTDKHKGYEPLARVYDKFLYSSDLNSILRDKTMGSDSAAIISSYVDQWVKKQLLLKRAEFNLEKENIDFTALIEDYRASLLIYEYKKQLLIEKVDTIVTQEHIEDYYTRNLQDFKLSGAIVKALYIRIDNNNNRVDEIRSLLRSKNESSFNKLVNLSYQYADRFDFFNDDWVSLSLIFKKIPDSPADENHFLTSSTLLEVEADGFIHFLQIHDYKLRGEIAPIEFVSDNIRDLVRNQRKIEYLSNLEKSIYQEALQKHDFEIFQ